MVERTPPEGLALIMILLKNKYGVDYPSSLFKFQSNYEYLKDMIRTGKLYLSTYNELNDPFDLFFFLPAEHLYSGGDDTVDVAKAFKDDNVRLIWHMNAFKISQKNRNDFKIYSMSSDAESKLLWGYYADAYKGFCIEYDFEYADKIMQDYIFPIRYELEDGYVPTVEECKDSTNIVSKKHKDWVHESEFRLVYFREDGVNRISFNKQMVRSIRFGYKVNDDKITDIIKLCYDNGFSHLKFYRWTHLHNKMYLMDLME